MSLAVGMDHALYRYRPARNRAPMAWPDRARVAFAPIVYLEHWPLVPAEGAHADPRFRDPHGSFQPDYRTHSWREYGNRIGIFRLFEVLERHGLTATLAVNASAVTHCPGLIEQALARGWEIAAHGERADAMVTQTLPAEAEAALIARCLDALQSATGTRPRGWIAQDFGESTRSLDLLAAAGIEWVAHWPNDDQPYWMTSRPPIVSVPQLSELDDVECLWHRRVATPDWPHLLEEAVSVLADEGGRCAVVGLHPWLFGMPHRIRYLDEGLRRIGALKGVWSTQVGAIAAHFKASQPWEDGP